MGFIYKPTGFYGHLWVLYKKPTGFHRFLFAPWKNTSLSLLEHLHQDVQDLSRHLHLVVEERRPLTGVSRGELLRRDASGLSPSRQSTLLRTLLRRRLAPRLPDQESAKEFA